MLIKLLFYLFASNRKEYLCGIVHLSQKATNISLRPRRVAVGGNVAGTGNVPSHGVCIASSMVGTS